MVLWKELSYYGKNYDTVEKIPIIQNQKQGTLIYSRKNMVLWKNDGTIANYSLQSIFLLRL